MIALQIAAQLLEMIARRHAQILIAGGIVDHLQLAKQAIFDVRRDAFRMDVIDKKSCNQL